VIRRILFWTHLVCGVAAGLVIVMMSATGVILTYERQLLDWADRQSYGAISAEGQRRPIEVLVASTARQDPEFTPNSVVISRDPADAVALVARRGGGTRYVDPYTGEVLGKGATGLREFLGATRGWHRWFNVSGEGRAPWRAITGASNLMFLFLLVSGIYLWLPRIFKWAALRMRLLFNRKALTGHVRDYNWHHVFGIWSVFPLILIVSTATVFSYSWSGDLLRWVFSDEPAAARTAAGVRAGQAAAETPGAASSGVVATGHDVGHAIPARPPDLDALFGTAAAQLADWREISLQLPEPAHTQASFTIDQGDGGQPQLRHTLTLDRNTAEIVDWTPFQSQSASTKARRWVRFLHTGEALGLLGQTIAGIVSLTSIIMVYTGLALACRRLILPLVRRRGARS
jgi:uncharacterized iron-regulated membrane protein